MDDRAVWIRGSRRWQSVGASPDRVRRPAYILDGDNLRHGLNADLGFLRPRPSGEHPARSTGRGAVRRRRNGGDRRDDQPVRRRSRHCPRIHEDQALEFHEIFVDTPLADCEQRDPKGSTRKARAGEIPDFTGISSLV